MKLNLPNHSAKRVSKIELELLSRRFATYNFQI